MALLSEHLGIGDRVLDSDYLQMQVTPRGLELLKTRAYFFFQSLHYQCTAHSRHLITDSLTELTSIRRQGSADFNKQTLC